ncbi:unnamed protein product [Phytophthora lilii]|uniref:RxLR effector protein n=1 Tax=Phytophthora lilii TaxID=2077276 RepID=A0A9W6X7B6_9STRA|nr:unnamed protein product [Phytophthora lilii]
MHLKCGGAGRSKLEALTFPFASENTSLKQHQYIQTIMHLNFIAVAAAITLLAVGDAASATATRTELGIESSNLDHVENYPVENATNGKRLLRKHDVDTTDDEKRGFLNDFAKSDFKKIKREFQAQDVQKMGCVHRWAHT